MNVLLKMIVASALALAVAAPVAATWTTAALDTGVSKDALPSSGCVSDLVTATGETEFLKVHGTPFVGRVYTTNTANTATFYTCLSGTSSLASAACRAIPVADDTGAVTTALNGDASSLTHQTGVSRGDLLVVDVVIDSGAVTVEVCPAG